MVWHLHINMFGVTSQNNTLSPENGTLNLNGYGHQMCNGVALTRGGETSPIGTVISVQQDPVISQDYTSPQKPIMLDNQQLTSMLHTNGFLTSSFQTDGYVDAQMNGFKFPGFHTPPPYTASYMGHIQSPAYSTTPESPESPPLPPRVYKPCVVCNDKSSGYHYGVSSCEGCKGFFRRSVQKNMQYTCHKDGKCAMNKTTRNRCQHCRLQKCFEQGMSKDAVRNDRNKKKKKKEPEEDTSSTSAPVSVNVVTDIEQQIIDQLLQSHLNTFPINLPNDGSEKEDNDEILRKNKGFLWEHVAELSTIGIKKIVAYSKHVPGFKSLTEKDQVTLLKASCLEILILRLSSRYKSDDETITFSNGMALTQSQLEAGGFGSLTETIFKFARSLHSMEADSAEFALLAAICLVSGDRSGLQGPEDVEKLQEPLLEALKHYARHRRTSPNHCFARMLMKLTDLRSISIKGAEKVLHLNKNAQDSLSPLLVEMLDRVENVVI